MYLKNTLLYITMYFYYILCVLIGYILNSHVSNNILNVITNQYEKIKNYRQLMKHANIKINYNMFRMLFMLLWQAAILIISQWFNKNVENIGKNKYQVQFCIGGKIYKIIIKHHKGPSNILHIVDNNDNDAENTDHIINFYSHGFEPRDSGNAQNGSGEYYIYLACAAAPVVGNDTNATPGTAG